MGHEKIARVRRLDWWVKASNMRSRTTSGGGKSYCHYSPPLLVLNRMFLAWTHQSCLRTRATFSWPICTLSLDFGSCGLEVACWPLVPKLAGSNPAEAVGFLRVNKIPQHVGGHGCLSVVIVVCCQVEVSATNWSLFQRSPTDCGASLSVI